jgi:hypothetical protein
MKRSFFIIYLIYVFLILLEVLNHLGIEKKMNLSIQKKERFYSVLNYGRLDYIDHREREKKSNKQDFY